MFEQSKWNNDNGSDIKNCTHSLSFSQNLIRTLEKRDLFNSGNGNNGESKLLNDGLVDNVNIFRQMVSASLDAIIMMDNNGKVNFWNKAAEKMFGYSEEEILNKDLHEILTPKLFREVSKEGFEKFKKSGQGAAIGKTLELTALRKNGEEFPIELSLSAAKTDEGWNSIGIVRDITERKEKEKKQKQQATFLNDNPAPVIISDWEGNIIEVNSAAEQIYGQEILTSSIYSTFSKIDKSTPISLNPNSPTRFEDTINDKTFLFTVKENIRTNEYYFYGIDISDKKRIEEELRKSEEKFKSFGQNSSIGIYRSNKIGKILFVNPALLHMLGYETIEDLQREKKAIDLYVDPEEREIFQCILEDEGTIFDFETKIKKRDGTEIIVKESSKIIKNGPDKDIIYQGVIQDITENKLMVEALKENEERFRITTVASGDVFYRLNFDSMVYEYMHPNIEKLTGYTAENINFSKIMLKMQHDNKPLDSASIMDNRHKNPEDIREVDYLIKAKNGKMKWISDRSYPWYDNTGKFTGSMGVLTDITKRKEIEKELTNAKVNAERADRMKSEFIAQMSHEIRTPINVLINSSNLFHDDLGDKVSDDMIENIDMIESSGKRILRTMDSILNYSEVKSGNYESKPEEMHLCGEVLSSIYNEYGHTAEKKNIQFQLEDESINSVIVGDKYSIKQILSHVIDNAIKFTTAGSILVRLMNIDNKLTCMIEDTGIGISEEYLSTVFTPFSQEYQGYSRKYEGNGIGLALAKEYCDRNNIDIQIESIKDEGTSVKLTFNNSKLELKGERCHESC